VTGIGPLVRSGRNPFEVWLLVACVAAGVVGLVAPDASSAIAKSLPHWELTCWYAGLTFGGLVSLVGVFSKGVNSLFIERVGMVVLTCLTLAYSVSIIVQVGAVKGATLPAFLTGLFAVACAVRFFNITIDLKRMEGIAIKSLDGDE
jgi:hypothetical protein